MDDPDLIRIQSAWRNASDQEVVRSLHHPDDYPADALSVLRAEANRRGLSGDELAPETFAPAKWLLAHLLPLCRGTFVQLTPLLTRLSQFGRSQPTILAVFVGVGFDLLGRGAPPPFGARWVIRTLLMVTFAVAALGACAWPLRSMRTVLRLMPAALLGCLAADLRHSYGLLNWVAQTHGIKVILGLLITSVVPWALILAVLCLVILLRNRYSPVYGPGRCAKCGYDLRGLPAPRCPECGTPFDPAESPPDGAPTAVAAPAARTDDDVERSAT